MDRRKILDEVIKEDKFPTNIKSDNLKEDQRLFNKMLNRDKNREIGVSTEKDHNLLWFFRRKKK